MKNDGHMMGMSERYIRSGLLSESVGLQLSSALTPTARHGVVAKEFHLAQSDNMKRSHTCWIPKSHILLVILVL